MAIKIFNGNYGFFTLQAISVRQNVDNLFWSSLSEIQSMHTQNSNLGTVCAPSVPWFHNKKWSHGPLVTWRHHKKSIKSPYFYQNSKNKPSVVTFQVILYFFFHLSQFVIIFIKFRHCFNLFESFTNALFKQLKQLILAHCKYPEIKIKLRLICVQQLHRTDIVIMT